MSIKQIEEYQEMVDQLNLLTKQAQMVMRQRMMRSLNELESEALK